MALQPYAVADEKNFVAAICIAGGVLVHSSVSRLTGLRRAACSAVCRLGASAEILGHGLRIGNLDSEIAVQAGHIGSDDDEVI